MKRNKSKQSGITLVSLVITIIILLILAGVAINMAVNSDGLFGHANTAVTKWNQTVAKEPETIQNLLNQAEEIINGGETIGKATVNEKADKNSTINGQKPSANNPIIPEGFIPINTETTSWGDGTTAPPQNYVDYGLVITDSVDEHGVSNGNEWVWVPIEDVNVLCDTVNGEECTLQGTSGSDAVKTKLYSKSSTFYSRTLPRIVWKKGARFS